MTFPHTFAAAKLLVLEGPRAEAVGAGSRYTARAHRRVSSEWAADPEVALVYGARPDGRMGSLGAEVVGRPCSGNRPDPQWVGDAESISPPVGGLVRCAGGLGTMAEHIPANRIQQPARISGGRALTCVRRGSCSGAYAGARDFAVRAAWRVPRARCGRCGRPPSIPLRRSGPS